MQFQADILNLPVERPVSVETTAFGAAGIAGITAGFWSQEAFLRTRKVDQVFRPAMAPRQREVLYRKWQEAVRRALRWNA